MAQSFQRELNNAHYKVFQMRIVLSGLLEQSADQLSSFCMTVFSVLPDGLSFVSSLRSFTICKISLLKDTFIQVVS